MNKTIETVTRDEAKQKGFPVFNDAPHTLIDLSDISEGFHTISVKLPNGDGATFCVIPFYQASGGKNGTIDIKYHNPDAETKVMGFSEGKTQSFSADMYTLDYRK